MVVTVTSDGQPPRRGDVLTSAEDCGIFSGYTKAIVNYSEYKGKGTRFVSLDEWREFSDLDRHTVVADPLYRDTAGRDFRLDPKSPNRGAGADGKTLGALDD